MILEDFEAIFHLVVIFNLAYVLSDHFIEIINKRISGAFHYVNEESNRLRREMDTRKDELMGLSKNKDKNLAFLLPDIKTVLPEIGQMISKQQELSEQIKRDINRSSVTKAFNYICLYCALYTITVMLVGGYLKQAHHETCGNCLVIFNILSLCFIFYCMLFERNWVKFFKLSYIRTIIAFFIFLGISLWVYYKKQFHSCWLGGISITTFSLWVAGSHFIIYSGFALAQTHIMGRAMRTKIKDLENDFLRKVDAHAGFILGLKKNYDGLQIVVKKRKPAKKKKSPRKRIKKKKPPSPPL